MKEKRELDMHRGDGRCAAGQSEARGALHVRLHAPGVTPGLPLASVQLGKRNEGYCAVAVFGAWCA